MPDWVTHSMVAWITGKTTNIDVGLVVIGSIIPDLSKINQVAIWLGTDFRSYFDPLHAPICALIIGAIIALFFENIKKAFIVIVIGIMTHFLLDFFLIGITKGTQFLYPVSLKYWRFNFIVADFRITLITVIIAFVIYSIYFYLNKKRKPLKLIS